MVMRVSLSDWLAFQARIRGSKDPRQLSDSPTDGAAWVAKICAETPQKMVDGCSFAGLWTSRGMRIFLAYGFAIERAFMKRPCQVYFVALTTSCSSFMASISSSNVGLLPYIMASFIAS